MASVLEVLRKELEGEIEAHTDALAKGRVEDYASYKQLVGTLSGLSLALNRLKDLQKYDEED
ncbi:MAG: hypothetical protein MUP73_00490 [Dehalococcoidia bacterium]|nr:hypothetical protein [Dehalococcoidia bacterium]|tara:strand:+ start:31 stop:216 length:186 start_codon:yes stop_codon:yes gene_type:complete